MKKNTPFILAFLFMSYGLSAKKVDNIQKPLKPTYEQELELCNQDPKLCVGAGTFEEQAGNKKMAEKFYNTACEKNIILGCSSICSLKYKNNDVEGLKKYCLMACQKGEPLCCHILGEEYEYKENNKEEAKKLYERSCKQKLLFSCGHLGSIAKQEKKYNEAKRLLKIACKFEKDYIEYCSDLGFVEDQLHNRSNAIKILTKACNLGSATGCAALGYINGEMGNVKEARRLFNKACSNGFNPACTALEDLNKQGYKSL